MTRSEDDRRKDMDRRLFLKWLGGSATASILALGTSCRFFQPVEGEDNPLSRAVSRDWEKIYHDQYRYDSAFDWVCSPNDTHACRVRS